MIRPTPLQNAGQDHFWHGSTCNLHTCGPVLGSAFAPSLIRCRPVPALSVSQYVHSFGMNIFGLGIHGNTPCHAAPWGWCSMHVCEVDIHIMHHGHADCWPRAQLQLSLGHMVAIPFQPVEHQLRHLAQGHHI